jgi:ABC-type nitrate/sulfonate/bicarbonate transport system substrate-binding protein
VLHACSEIAPLCPEKWLVMRAEKAGGPAAGALVRAVSRAARWSADAGNHPILARHLARADYVGVPSVLIEPLLGPSDLTLAGPSRAPWIRLDEPVTSITPEQVERVHAMMLDAGHLGPEAASLPQILAMTG